MLMFLFEGGSQNSKFSQFQIFPKLGSGYQISNFSQNQKIAKKTLFLSQKKISFFTKNTECPWCQIKNIQKNSMHQMHLSVSSIIGVLENKFLLTGCPKKRLTLSLFFFCKKCYFSLSIKQNKETFF